MNTKTQKYSNEILIWYSQKCKNYNLPNTLAYLSIATKAYNFSFVKLTLSAASSELKLGTFWV